MRHWHRSARSAALLCAASALLLLFSASASPGGDMLRAKIVGLRSDDGKVHCTLFNSSGFPDDDSKAIKNLVVPIKDHAAECDFEGIPPGEYAIVTFHDENNNGEFDKNFLGMPKEGFAFSDNFHPKLSKPTFDDCKFDYKGGEQTVTIEMIYW